jgi:hypothetical protein
LIKTKTNSVEKIEKKKKKKIKQKYEYEGKHKNFKNSDLPVDWKMEVKQRKSGKSSGRLDYYFTSPLGVQFRSMAQVKKFLEKK